jgi:hypothetical protein
MAERGLVEAGPIWTTEELTRKLDEPTTPYRWQFATAAQAESWIDPAEADISDIDRRSTIPSDYFRYLWSPASRSTTTDARHLRLALTLSEESIDFRDCEWLQQSRPRQWTPRATWRARGRGDHKMLNVCCRSRS